MTRHVLVVDAVDSTQDVARRWVAEGRPHGVAVRARVQTAGRGRLGRVWQAAPDDALLLSVLLRPRLAPRQWGLLSLAAAVAVRAAVGDALGIKWPNDLLAPDGRKVAGVLAEAEHGPDGAAVVLGVGVNVRGAPPGAACLAELGLNDDVDAVAEAVRAAVLGEVERLTAAPATVLDRWRAGAVTLGRDVVVGDVRGRAVDVDEDGALLIVVDGVTRRVVAGDVVFDGR